MIDESVLTPTQFVEGFNQLIEYNLPTVVIEGEIADFRVSKDRWLYFNLADESASLACFGTVYQLKTPIESGMMVRLVAAPKLHPKFNFSLNVLSLTPVGEGALKRSAELLKAKLSAEGLFNPERKRQLPYAPAVIGLITSRGSAAYHDFVKILDERWCGTTVLVSDALVQGENSPASLVSAIEHQNLLAEAEVLVVTRGGGSAEDLMAFNDESVVRAVAASRIPTLVAIGHEVDLSLAELAADLRASTPSNAVQLLVPDKKAEQIRADSIRKNISQKLSAGIDMRLADLQPLRNHLLDRLKHDLAAAESRLEQARAVIKALNPNNVLKRGYALVKLDSQIIKSARAVSVGIDISSVMHDGTIVSTVKSVNSPEKG